MPSKPITYLMLAAVLMAACDVMLHAEIPKLVQVVAQEAPVVAKIHPWANVAPFALKCRIMRDEKASMHARETYPESVRSNTTPAKRPADRKEIFSFDLGL